MSRPNAPALPDGLVVVVKRECETCRMVAPLLGVFLDRVLFRADGPSVAD